MKKLVLIFLPFSIIFIIFSQNSIAEVPSKITFKDGKKITGVIIPNENSDSLYIQLDGGFKAAYPKKNIQKIESMRSIFSLGLGIGIPYAMFGINSEIECEQQIDLTFGIGTTLLAGLAWDIGMVGYLLDQDKLFRPRISLIYGTNAIIGYTTSQYNSTSKYESFTGLSIGAGLKFSNSFTVDAFYLLIDGSKDRQKELEKFGYKFDEEGIPIKFSIGYQFSF
jgi:hypothetical protein